MKKLCRNKQRIILLSVLTVFVFLISIYSFILFSIPRSLSFLTGEEGYLFRLKTPINLVVKTDREGTILLNGNITNSKVLALSSPISITTLKDGKTNLKLKLFGFIPLRTVVINAYPNFKVIPCGNAIGVKIHTHGALIIAVSDVEGVDGKIYCPSKQQGLKPGDVIIEIEGQPIKDTDQLIEQINKSGGRKISVKYKRNNEYNTVKLYAVQSKEDGKFRIGLWVRDGTAGIGTLTCYNPETGAFAALGHGITDIDTGSLLPLGEGEILQSKILSVNKGGKGKTGELKGVFIENNNKIGKVIDNCDFGIYGEIFDYARNYFKNEPMPICLRSQVKEGPAQILTNIQDDKVEAFDIVINKITQQSLKSSKGMTIHVTDSRLLNSTGGIVQGMSGSPIIQNDRLVGAVTHVLINKPEYGYGIFIEWMIEEMQRIENSILKK